MFRDPIKSAARTLEVLELFNELRAPLSLTDIYQRLEYPQSSATFLLKSMVMMGYLNYDRASRTYFPSARVAALGDWISHYMFGPGDLTELIRFVFERTDETVAISSQNDIFVQHVRILVPAHEHKNPPSEGTMRVLTASASGVALLSQIPRPAAEKLVSHINIHLRHAGPTPGERVDTQTLEEQLNWVAREGYCIMADHPIRQFAGIAMPLPRANLGMSLSLAVGGLNSRIMRKHSEIVAVMREAVADYSAKLAQARADAAVVQAG